MTTTLVVIVCHRAGRGAGTSLESVAQQTRPPSEVVVVCAGIDEKGRAVLERLAAQYHAVLIERNAPSPAALRNAAIGDRGVDFVVCLNEGDTLAPEYIEAASTALANEQRPGFVGAWSQKGVPGGRALVASPPTWDRSALLRDAWAAPVSPMFRREIWSQLSGFDETLAGLDEYDFWLRAIAAGWRGCVLERALVYVSVDRQSVYRAGLDGDHATAMAQVLAKHQPLFEDNFKDVLLEKERTFRELLDRHATLVRRRDDILAELNVARKRSAELVEFLREHESGGVDWGDLRRTSPLSRNWGYSRGKPIDRFYIERFIETHAHDVHGAVLEIQEDGLTRQFGAGPIERVDVLDINPDNLQATIIADLRTAENIASNTYDCLIVTQTLHLIDDIEAVLAQCARILKPGGVLLATFPSQSRLCVEYGPNRDFWRLTAAGARVLFEKFFPGTLLDIRAHGNVLVNAAFLYGLACHELTDREFETVDPDNPLLITIRAQKAADGFLPEASSATVRRNAGRAQTNHPAAVLLYHRVADVRYDVHSLAVGIDEFTDQMEHLSREYNVLPLEELLDCSAQGFIPPRAVAVTFDDAYVDNFETASPILEHFKLPATFFVTTEFVDDTHEFWWDTLERVFLCGDHLPPTLDIEWQPDAIRGGTRTEDERLAAHWLLYRTLYPLPVAVRDVLLARIVVWSGLRLPVRPRHRPMTREEVRRLSQRPRHTIGGHGHSHLALPAHTVDIQREEVRRNQATLREITGQLVRVFAYPYGDVNAMSAATVGESFDGAVTCSTEPFRRGHDPLQVPRHLVKPSGLEAFATFVDRATRDRG